MGYYSTIGGAQGGVDGVKNGGYGFCTALEKDPWWEVDLLGVYNIDEIILFNRADGGQDRADTLAILLSTDQQEWRRLPEWRGGRFGGIDGRAARIRPKQAIARYVRLQLNETNYLHLDEVEVYGTPVNDQPDLEILPDDAAFRF
jgi:hypothetical protein